MNLGHQSTSDFDRDLKQMEGTWKSQEVQPKSRTSSYSSSSMDVEEVVEPRTSSYPAQGSSLFIPEYDVFVSFRGTDVRKTFASHVVHKLVQSRLRTFFDETELNVGDQISSILKKAEESEMFVIIFSKNYAESKFCLMEAAIAFKSRRKIFPIFYHVKPSDVKHQEGDFGKGFLRLIKEVDSKELIEEWKDALQHAAEIKGFEVDQNTYEIQVIKELAEKIQNELMHVNVWTLPKYQVGLDSHVTKVRQLLSLEDNSKVLMVVISGGIGFGKTTIAEATYNKIWRSFDSCSFLRDIAQKTSEAASKKDELLALQNELIQDMQKRANFQRVGDIRLGTAHIRNSISTRKVLIILDDVDSDEQLQYLGMTNYLNDLIPGSRVIVTTRIQCQELWPPALRREGVNYEVRELTKEDSLKLFCCHAFGTEKPTKEYVKNCEEAISKIESSPLAIQFTAPHFRGLINPSLWKMTLENFNFLSKQLEELLSIPYAGLCPEVQRVFIDAACFLVGTELNVAASILEGWREEPLIAIAEMKRASLLKHNRNNSLEMQSTVRKLGMKLAKREKNDPMKRCRLWDHGDVSSVLQDLEYKEVDPARNIECMALESKEAPGENAALTQTVLEKLPNLRILQINQWPMKEKIDSLPNRLKWLRWKMCDTGKFSCCFDNLQDIAVLDLSYSQLDQKWFERAKALKGLKVLNLSHCKSLTSVPDLSGFISLEKLILDGCEMLIAVHSSVGKLETLNVLKVRWCCRLQNLPDDVWTSKFLEVLDISHCRQLAINDQLLGTARSLKQVIICKTKAAEMPDSLPVLQIPCDSNCAQIEIVVDGLEEPQPGCCNTKATEMPDSLPVLQIPSDSNCV